MRTHHSRDLSPVVRRDEVAQRSVTARPRDLATAPKEHTPDTLDRVLRIGRIGACGVTVSAPELVCLPSPQTRGRCLTHEW
jgi:hypothetical protein